MDSKNNNPKSFWKDATSNHWNWNDTQVNSAIRVTALILVSLLSVFTLVKTMSEIKGFSTVGEAPVSPYMITVSGKAEVAAIKDLALVSFSSYGKGKTATEAQSLAAESNNKAIAFLKSKGVEEKDITTDSYNTYPTYDQKVKPCIVEGYSGGAEGSSVINSGAPDAAVISVSATRTSAPSRTMIAPVAPCNNYEQVIIGYETNQSVSVKIRNIVNKPELTGEIITGLGVAGVQVGNLQNIVDNEDVYKTQARNMAIAKAHLEAKSIARALGARLGKVVSFNENNYGYPMYERSVMNEGAKADAAPVTPNLPVGEGKVVADVSVTYEIR